jgi:hypothetical protein
MAVTFNAPLSLSYPIGSRNKETKPRRRKAWLPYPPPRDESTRLDPTRLARLTRWRA